MPFREDLDAAMAHAESAERELLAAREQNAADHERIAELEAELANAQRGVQRTKGRAPPADEPTQAGQRGNTVGAALGRVQLRHAGVLVFLGALVALGGAISLVASFWGGVQAHPGGYNALPPGGVLVAGLALVYHFWKPTRGGIVRGKIQGNFQWRDLRNLDISQVELIQCQLQDSDLRGATLEGSTFTQCHFEGSDLRGARLDGATFEQCEFDGAQLEEVSVNDTKFAQCHLRGTAIAKGLKGATLQQCDV